MEGTEDGSSWTKLLKVYFQETTVHGVRYTVNNGVTSRRLVWVLIVAVSFVSFSYLIAMNIVRFNQRPKTIDIGRTPRHSMTFPAVTVCNPNLFRKSAMFDIGMYDTITSYGKSNAAEDREVFTYNASVCETFDSLKQKSLWSDLYVYVSSSVCQTLCSKVASTTCSSILYHRGSKTCMMSSSTEDSTIHQWGRHDILEECEQFEFYRRHMKVISVEQQDIYCTWENECDFGPYKLNGWLRVLSKDTVMGVDHTLRRDRGHFMLYHGVMDTSNTTSEIFTSFYQFNSACLEFFYFVNGSMTLEISYIGENLTAHLIKEFSDDLVKLRWTRGFISLPSGLYKLKFRATKSTGDIHSYIAVDDVHILTCEKLRRNCLRSTSGSEFIGDLTFTENGKTCEKWPGSDHNYCRNPNNDPKGPWCYLRDRNMLTRAYCNIPFCECAEGYSRCGNGECYHSSHRCDGKAYCADRSDEDCDFEMSCSFDDNAFKLCGYSKYHFSGQLWDRQKASKFIGSTIKTDSAGFSEGRFVILNPIGPKEGNIGFLMSPKIRCFKAASLQLMVRFHTTGGDHGTVLRVLKEDTVLSGYGDVLYDLRFEDMVDKLDTWMEIDVPLPVGRYGLVIEGCVHVTSVSELVIDFININEQCVSDNAMKIDSEIQEYARQGNISLSDFRQASSTANAAWVRRRSTFNVQNVPKVNTSVFEFACDKRLINQTGYFTSWNYPDGFRLSTVCNYILYANGLTNFTIEFIHLDLGECTEYSCDRVEIILMKDFADVGTVFRTIYQLENHTKFSVQTGVVRIKLISDEEITHKGFSVSYHMESVSNVDDDMLVLFYTGSWSVSHYESWLVSPLWTFTSLYLSLDYIAYYDLTIELISANSLIQTLREVDKYHGHWRRIGPLRTHGTFAHLRIRVKFQIEAKIRLAIAAIRKVQLLSHENTENSRDDECPEGEDMCGFRDVSGLGLISTWERRTVDHSLHDRNHSTEGFVFGCRIDINTDSCRIQSPPIPSVGYAATAYNMEQKSWCLSFSTLCESCHASTTLTFCQPDVYDGSNLSCEGLGYVNISDREGWLEVRATVNSSEDGIIIQADGVNGMIEITDIKLQSDACQDEDGVLMMIDGVPEPWFSSNDPVFEDSLETPEVHQPVTSTLKDVSSNVSSEEAMGKIKHQLEDMIIWCRWKGQNCTHMFQEFKTFYGSCYIFNGDPDNILETDNTDVEAGGLDLLLNIELYEWTEETKPQILGIMMAIHDQQDLPYVGQGMTYLPNNKYTHLTTSKSQFTRLKYPYGECTSGSRNLKHFENGQVYTQQKCNINQITKEFLNRTSCRFYGMPGKDEVCDMTGFLKYNSLIPGLTGNEPECTPACDETYYTTDSSHGNIFAPTVLGDILDVDLETRFAITNWISLRANPDTFLSFKAAADSLISTMTDVYELLTLLSSDHQYAPVGLVKQYLGSLYSYVNKDFESLRYQYEPLQNDYRFSYKAVRSMLKSSLVDLRSLSLIYYNNDGLDSNDVGHDNRVDEILRTSTRVRDILEYIRGFETDSIENLAVQYKGTKVIPDSYYPKHAKLECRDDLNSMLLKAHQFINMSNDVSFGKNASFKVQLQMIFEKEDVISKCLDQCEEKVDRLFSYIDEKFEHFEFDDSMLRRRYVNGLLDELNTYFNDYSNSFNTFKLNRMYFSQYMRTIATIIRSGIVNSAFDSVEDGILSQLTIPIDNMFQKLTSRYTGFLERLAPLESYYNETDLQIAYFIKQLSIWQQPIVNGNGDISFVLSEEQAQNMFPTEKSFRRLIKENTLTHALESTLGKVKTDLKSILNFWTGELKSGQNKVNRALQKVYDIVQYEIGRNKIDENFVSDNIARVTVTYKSLEYEHMVQKEGYTLPDFWGDFGGYMGLFLGASIITLCEILDLLIYNTYMKFKLRGSRDKVFAFNGHH